MYAATTKENELGYSDEWQDYRGYEKFEYDIETKGGEVITNCYPNAGFFNKFSSEVRVNEEDVARIRFSNNPQSILNVEVSNCRPQPVFPDYSQKAMEVFELVNHYADEVMPFDVTRPKPPQYIRPEKKAGRNEMCSCGSGKKFKRCCLKTQNQMQ